MRCRGSRTWHVEDGIALVHGKHVGAGANVRACILGLDVLNGQDAVEVHGPVGQLPVTHPCPHQGVGWGLALRSADKVDGRPNPDSLGFGLLDCNLNGFGWDTCDNDLSAAPVGAALVSAGTDIDSGISRLDVGEVQLRSLSASVSSAGDRSAILSRPVEIVRGRAGHLTPESDRATMGRLDLLWVNLHH